MWYFLAVIALSLAEKTETETDVALTQICIWLPIVLASVLIYAVYLMFSMDNGRDSLLYAKFLMSEVQKIIIIRSFHDLSLINLFAH